MTSTDSPPPTPAGDVFHISIGIGSYTSGGCSVEVDERDSY